MRHLILAITIIALIVYSTNIIGCRSTGTPVGRDQRGGPRVGGGGP